MDRTERPITADDFKRIHALLYAYHLKEMDGDEEALWEVLYRFHEDQVHPEVVPLDSLVGEEGAARERHHAFLVIGALMRGSSTVLDSTRAPLSVCGTPGCPNLTHGRLCLNCELAEGGPKDGSA